MSDSEDASGFVHRLRPLVVIKIASFGDEMRAEVGGKALC